MSVERKRDGNFVCAVLSYWTDGFKSSQLWKLLREKTPRGQPLPGSMQFVIRLQEMSFCSGVWYGQSR